ncbi:uracil-DNA glycosylase family protein [Halobellus salinus]|uniref:uracil-DNA glycosylase family protein n=1 Tax=Halobellus salinus TaxID=931585 RepID=UPI001668ED38|nr:uracil-DNA glycosylase family protein [Halobellus salinus]SMP03517.1 Uracil-DNA glycosylase [Halobellus salinus]
MENVTDRISNPFGMCAPCKRFVAGYGDANAAFHVIGDHPGVHGGLDTGVPFTNAAGRRLQAALADAGLLAATGDAPVVAETFLSYLHPCALAETPPSRSSYDELEPVFDAELRAIAAHVLLPVGARATAHVLETYTAHPADGEPDMESLHAAERVGRGFLVIPIVDPAAWNGTHHDRLVDGLGQLQSTDFRREADLGRFLPGDESYLVR